MTPRFTMVTAAALALSAGMATAQGTVFTGTDLVDDQSEALRDQIAEDFERDTRIGNEGRPLGFDGSVALRATASDGNSDSSDIGLAANFGYFDGTNGYELQLSYKYGEEEGVRTEESLLYDFEYTRDFNPRLFAFGKVQGSIDDFSSFESDTFLGLGLGYRVISRADVQWSVQAGPGYRVADLTSVSAEDFEEGAVSVSSNYSNRLSEGITLTFDTDAIFSESDTVVYNDIGVNYAVGSSGLALRTSLQSEYHTDPLPGLDDTDHTYGLSLVYSFN